jgi:hypothetical protein
MCVICQSTRRSLLTCSLRIPPLPELFLLSWQPRSYTGIRPRHGALSINSRQTIERIVTSSICLALTLFRAANSRAPCRSQNFDRPARVTQEPKATDCQQHEKSYLSRQNHNSPRLEAVRVRRSPRHRHCSYSLI